MIWGEDSTIESISKVCPLPIKGFGSKISISIINDLSHNSAELIAKDTMSLGQKGCRSTRLLILNTCKNKIDKLNKPIIFGGTFSANTFSVYSGLKTLEHLIKKKKSNK